MDVIIPTNLVCVLFGPAIPTSSFNFQFFFYTCIMWNSKYRAGNGESESKDFHQLLKTGRNLPCWRTKYTYTIVSFSMTTPTGDLTMANLKEGCCSNPVTKYKYMLIITIPICDNVIGASLSEPHINGTAVCEWYIIYYSIMVRRSCEIISPAWLYECKREIFYCAFSCLGYGPYVRRSNLANCRFTLVCFVQYRHRGINVEPREQ